MAHPRIRSGGTGLVAAFIGLLLFVAWRPGLAAQVAYGTAFSVPHNVVVSTGLVSVGGTFTSTSTASGTPTPLPQFNPAMGRLTKATVSIATSSSTFPVVPQGLLSLVASATATRRVAYGVTAGATSATDAAEVTTSGSGLLTLLGLGGADIGGAVLNSATAFTAQADLLRFTGTGTLPVTVSTRDTLTISALVSLVNGGGMAASGTVAGTVTVTYEYTPWPLSGYVYQDTDRNGARGPAETGTGLTLYAKLLSGTSGPALQAVPVDPSTGFYAFSTSRGNFRVVIDDNTTLSDVTPLVPPTGWSPTQAPTLFRDVVVGTESPPQDFGLVRATRVAGRVFLDNGAGGGTAHDGVSNGAEPGLSGRTLVLLDAGGTRLDSTVTAGDGTYALYVPSTVANGATLRARLLADSAYTTTGGAVGTTGGTYTRANDEVAFSLDAGNGYTGVNFGSMAMPTLSGGSVLAGMTGTVLVHAHRFTAPAAGQVVFSVATGAPAWPVEPMVDTNANGQLDAGDVPLTAAMPVASGQSVSVLVKVTLPAGAAPDTRMLSTLSAAFTYANSSPTLTVTPTAVDQSWVASPGSGALVLVKSANQAAVQPGDTLVYTIAFSNSGLTPLNQIVIHDATPAFTKFAWTTTNPLPSGLAGPAVVAPSVGGTGDIRWTFSGSLAPGASGAVKFAVVVD